MAQSSDLVTVIQLAGGRTSSRIKFTTRAFLSLKQTQFAIVTFHSTILKFGRERRMYPPLTSPVFGAYQMLNETAEPEQ